MHEHRTKRLFAAVKIHAGDEFVLICNQMKLALQQDRITWVHTANLHLTLKFFGETPVDNIPAIAQCLLMATANISSFELAIRHAGIFGSKYDPRVIWFGLEAGTALQELHDSVNEQLKSISIFPDRQNFVPHLTVGRIKQIADKRLFQQTIEKFKECNLGSQKINTLSLFESILKREGPTHNALQTYRFQD